MLCVEIQSFVPLVSINPDEVLISQIFLWVYLKINFKKKKSDSTEHSEGRKLMQLLALLSGP